MLIVPASQIKKIQAFRAGYRWLDEGWGIALE